MLTLKTEIWTHFHLKNYKFGQIWTKTFSIGQLIAENALKLL